MRSLLRLAYDLKNNGFRVVVGRFAAYQKCRRRKRSWPAAAAFDFQWESNLFGLQREGKKPGVPPDAHEGCTPAPLGIA